VACGPGLSLSALSSLMPGHQLYGIDRSLEMLKLAAQNAAGAAGPPHLAHASALQLPFRDHMFDIVYATRFLHMFRDKTPVVRELRRVLRHRGGMIIEFYNRPYHVARYVAQRPSVPFEEYLYHFPTFAEVRGLVGRKARFIPLRLGGERWLRAVVGERRLRSFLARAWNRPFRPLIDEYFAVVDASDLA
jgi:ubiquinone/menaquinone biosynthesis C-methylase UbiE